ncbi:hypothetical protein INT45_013451 [Circinella minor]|uniref:Uncharacterized protein n=1 Tax=Circinella minor TaxID=1195481 RepID=A0A8H7R7W9_9FUNG|nr:hypothetical protein INT45_013451 [Circinella minor]
MPRAKGQKKAAKKRARNEKGIFFTTEQPIATNITQNQDQVPIKNAFDMLQWKKNSDSHLRGTYNHLVPSRTKEWRDKTLATKKQQEMMKMHKPISQLFSIVDNNTNGLVSTDVDGINIDNNDNFIDYTDEDMLSFLIGVLDEATWGLETVSSECDKDYVKRHLAIKMYIKNLVDHKMTRGEASMKAAHFFYPHSNAEQHSYCSRIICEWANEFYTTGTVPMS